MSTQLVSTDERQKGDGGHGLRHGLKCRLPLARLPARFAWIKRKTNLFRREIEAELIQRHGTISTWQAARIATACLAMRQRAIVDKILAAEDSSELTHEQWIAFSDRLIRYSESADRALESLGLDKAATQSAFERLYANVGDVEAVKETSGASNSES